MGEVGIDEKRAARFRDALEAAVPLWIMGMRDRSLEDILDPQGLSEIVEVIATKADLVVRGEKGCGEVFNRIAEGIARLSFCPGGVYIFGMEFRSGPANAGDLKPAFAWVGWGGDEEKEAVDGQG